MHYRRGKRCLILTINCCVVFLSAIFLFKADFFQAEEIQLPHLVINEVLPKEINDSDHPSEPFIELMNIGIVEYDTSSCILQDRNYFDNNKSTSLKKILLPPGGYLTLYKQDYGFVLNYASAETIFLTCGDEKDSIKYLTKKKPAVEGHFQYEEGKSISRVPNGRYSGEDISSDFQNVVPTPEINLYEEIIPSVDEEKGGMESTTIAQSKENNDGEEVIVQGRVTALPDLLSSNYFYIQDESGGIQIYNYDKDFPILLEGDMISVAGVMSTTSGERRIKISDPTNILILGHQEIISPQKVAISNLSKAQVGQYITISGTVSKTSGDTFYISDGKGVEIKILIKEGAGITKPKMRKGDSSQVSGVLSIYNGGLRILPFKQEDVKIIPVESSGLPEAGPGLFLYSYLIFTFILIWNLLLIAKKIRMRLRKKSLIKLRAVMLLLYTETLGAARQPLPVF